jgi:hypothetical protein
LLLPGGDRRLPSLAAKLASALSERADTAPFDRDVELAIIDRDAIVFQSI